MSGTAADASDDPPRDPAVGIETAVLDDLAGGVAPADDGAGVVEQRGGELVALEDADELVDAAQAVARPPDVLKDGGDDLRGPAGAVAVVLDPRL